MLISWLLCICFIFSRTPCAYLKPVNTPFPVQDVASPLAAGITHHPAQIAPRYPATFNSSIRPRSIATMARAVSYTGAAASKTQSETFSVDLNNSMNRTGESAFDHQACCFMVQDTLQARFWADYKTLTATFTKATTIVASVTRYIDTIITNYETVDSWINTTSTYVSQVGSIPPTQTMDCNVPIIPTQLVGLNDSRNEPNKTMYSSIFYVYSTVKIIQVPPVTSTNGVFQCTTTSEFLAPQSSITFDSNPYLGSYYLSQPTAAVQLPSPLFNNALQSAANTSVHVDTIITFPTPFTYLPSVGDRLEGLGYVPRSMLDWVLQQDDYIGQASLLTLCSPGGPPLGALNKINSVPNTFADIPAPTGTDLYTALTNALGPNVAPSSTMLSNGVVVPLVNTLASDVGGDLSTAIGNVAGGVSTIASNIGGAATTAVSNPVAGVDTVVGNLISSPSPTATAPVIPVATDSNGNVISNTAVASNTVITLIIPGVINTVGSVLSELTAAAGSVIPASITNSLGQLVPNPTGAPTILGDTLLPSAPTVIGNTLMPLPVITDGAGDMPKAGPVVAIPGKDLTVSTAVTVTSAGCFNPEACPTIRSSRALTANSASADLISQTVKSGRPGTTVAGSERGDTTGTADRALPLTFTIGDQVFRPHPAGFSIDGTTISAGGRGVTIAGTAIQLESSGILKIGTSLVSISNTAILDDDLQLAAYSVGGQVFTPNWIAFPIAGTTISAGGPGVTIAGTPVRLETSGILKIGTSMVSIANVASTTGHSWLTTHAVDTALITPNPTTSAVTGTTFSAGGAGTTNPGIPIILGTSGDGETGGSTLTSTTKHPLQTSTSPSEGHNNPIVRKRLGILFVMYLVYRIIAFL